ncbi:hypothetical protein C8Q77DRAFT_780506 [Trametes polyzona]|nr:hypothetical protein C8Q77DRAFT_780506 [Trametes polyzona]
MRAAQARGPSHLPLLLPSLLCLAGLSCSAFCVGSVGLVLYFLPLTFCFFFLGFATLSCARARARSSSLSATLAPVVVGRRSALLSITPPLSSIPAVILMSIYASLRVPFTLVPSLHFGRASRAVLCAGSGSRGARARDPAERSWSLPRGASRVRLDVRAGTYRPAQIVVALSSASHPRRTESSLRSHSVRRRTSRSRIRSNTPRRSSRYLSTSLRRSVRP